MRSILEKAREAQAIRVANDPSADLEELELGDFQNALENASG